MLNEITYLVQHFNTKTHTLKRSINEKQKFLWFSNFKTMPNFEGFCQPISSSIEL